MTRRALAAVGGIGAIVAPGESVFIKPNFVFAGLVDGDIITTGDCTKPEIALTVAEACLQAGASRVVIGEGAQVDRFSWSSLRLFDGSSDMEREAKRLRAQYGNRLTLACLNADSPAWDSVPAPSAGLGKLRVSSLAARADRVISLPVAKTHQVTGVTLGMKNLIGVTSLHEYALVSERTGLRLKLHDAPGGIDGCIVDVNAALRSSLTLVDCSVGCEGNGPRVEPGKWGSSVDTRSRIGAWVLVASTDGLAADATTTRMIGLDPSTVDHLSRAWSDGLGQLRDDLISLDGAAWSAVRMRWKAAEGVTNLRDLVRAL